MSKWLKGRNLSLAPATRALVMLVHPVESSHRPVTHAKSECAMPLSPGYSHWRTTMFRALV